MSSLWHWICIKNWSTHTDSQTRTKTSCNMWLICMINKFEFVCFNNSKLTTILLKAVKWYSHTFTIMSLMLCDNRQRVGSVFVVNAANRVTNIHSALLWTYAHSYFHTPLAAAQHFNFIVVYRVTKSCLLTVVNSILLCFLWLSLNECIFADWQLTLITISTQIKMMSESRRKQSIPQRRNANVTDIVHNEVTG